MPKEMHKNKHNHFTIGLRSITGILFMDSKYCLCMVCGMWICKVTKIYIFNDFKITEFRKTKY